MTHQRIAEHIEIDWLDRQSPATACPCCGYQGPVTQYLDIDYQPPEARHRFILQICPACSVRFVDNTHTMDYASDNLIEIGWHTYQIQLGAGVWPISAPLTRVNKPAGAKVLEIGGAYGFGLDFCIRARGWTGEGFDPSPLAAFGARELGVSVTQDYFEEKDLARGPYDVVIATEVIEHLEHPPEFLKLMRQALADDGILVLSTPDAACITRDLPAAQLMPLLSPGAHVVLQTAESLEKVLRAAGFAHVIVKTGGLSLVAYASASPFTLNDDAAAGRALYRKYLVERSALTAELSDLRLGFAGRGYFEACNDGDEAAADIAWAALVPAVKARFGLDLETMTALPEGAADTSLLELSGKMPLGLGMVLFSRAMYLVAAKTDRAALLPILTLSRAAATALLKALAKRSLTDGLTASLAHLLDLEIALCLAQAGDPASLPLLLPFATARDGESPAWRGFMSLVSAGALDLAAQFKEAAGLTSPSLALPTEIRRDALLSLANVALSPGGDTQAAFPHALALRALPDEPAATAIILQAFTRLVNASQYRQALAAAAKYEVDRLALAASEETHGKDAKLARMVLDLAAGDPAMIPARLRGLELPAAQRAKLLLEAFIRLVNAERHDEALIFSADYGVPALMDVAGGETAHNANLAHVMLELATGDPAAVPERIKGLNLSPSERAKFLLEAFIRLVNASRHDEALAYAQAHDLAALIPVVTVAGQDAAVAWAVAELSAGDPAMVPARLAGTGVEAARQQGLVFAAFTGLVSAARYEDAETMAAAEKIFSRLAKAEGKEADDARLAEIYLDLHRDRIVPACRKVLALEHGSQGDRGLLATLYVSGFVRLMNAASFDAARSLAAGRAVERRLAACPKSTRHDGLAALLILELQPGGAATRIPQLLDEAITAGLETSRLHGLALAAFVTLVNRTDFATARLLRHLVDPILQKLRAPYDEAGQNALFAAGMLALQERAEWRRSVTCFARLRDDLIKKHPPGGMPAPLFWPAMRGEVLALHQLGRSADVTALLQSFIPAYPDAPEDLRAQLGENN